MKYKKLYEKKYGEKKLVNLPKKQYWGLRRLLRKYDWDRYALVEQLIHPSKRILDIGSGEGYMLRRLKDKFDELYGLDITPSRLKEAKAKIKEIDSLKVSKFKFVEGNADDSLPFPNESFDVIICIAVLEHVYDIFSLVKEIFRVLKPGGYIVVEVPNIAYLKHRISLLLGLLPVTSSPYNWKEFGWDGGHIHYFTMKKFSLLFSSQGFHIEEKLGSGFMAKFRNWWPTILCGDLIIKATK